MILHKSENNYQKEVSMNKRMQPFSSMKEAIRHLRNEGFVHEFLISPDGIQDPLTKQRYSLKSLSLCDLYHLDLNSRFPNLEVIYALEADDGTRGWLSSANNGNLDELLLQLSARETKPSE
jgi:hypothetical protein